MEEKLNKLLQDSASTKVHVEYIREHIERQQVEISKVKKDIEELKKWKWKEAGFLAAIVLIGKLVWHKIEAVIP